MECGGWQSEHQSPGQRVPLLPLSPPLPEASLGPRWGSLGGNGARSHDARRGEDGAHAQGVRDLPATGQRLAHALGVLVLFCRQQLPLQGFPARERGSLEAAGMGPIGQELPMAPALGPPLPPLLSSPQSLTHKGKEPTFTDVPIIVPGTSLTV